MVDLWPPEVDAPASAIGYSTAPPSVVPSPPLMTPPVPAAPPVRERGAGSGICFGALVGMLAGAGVPLAFGAVLAVSLSAESAEPVDVIFASGLLGFVGLVVGAPVGTVLGAIVGGALGAARSAVAAPWLAAGICLLIGSLLGQVMVSEGRNLVADTTAVVLYLALVLLSGGIGWLSGKLFMTLMRP